KYAAESLQGCEGAKYVYDLEIQTTTSNHLSRYGEFLVTVHEGGYAKTSGRLNQRLFHNLTAAVGALGRLFQNVIRHAGIGARNAIENDPSPGETLEEGRRAISV